MRKNGIGPLLAIVIAICVALIVAHNEHSGRRRTTQSAASSPAPAPSRASATRTPAASPSPKPVTYVPAGAPATTPAVSSTAAPAATATPRQLVAGSTPSPVGPVEAVTMAPVNVAPPVLREPADAPPRILSMSLSTPVARGGETIFGTVETTSNVASVVARIGGYSSPMQKVGVGKFRIAYTVPHLPFFLHRTWTVDVIARNSRGDAVTSSIPVTIR